jgi:hypothetical protein
MIDGADGLGFFQGFGTMSITSDGTSIYGISEA